MTRFSIVAVATAALAGVAALAWLRPELAASHPPALALGDTAPEFTGIEAWLNSPPLRLAELRGKVVLVDFWTYACVNCVRTLPALNRWHERYAAQGLVLVGVHTPEFPFERELDNVEAAIRRFEIAYPVALDNRYRTWTAWRNRYWPAVYLIDREGRLVLAHAGEGEYEAIEQAIEDALAAGA